MNRSANPVATSASMDLTSAEGATGASMDPTRAEGATSLSPDAQVFILVKNPSNKQRKSWVVYDLISSSYSAPCDDCRNPTCKAQLARKATTKKFSCQECYDKKELRLKEKAEAQAKAKAEALALARQKQEDEQIARDAAKLTGMFEGLVKMLLEIFNLLEHFLERSGEDQEPFVQLKLFEKIPDGERFVFRVGMNGRTKPWFVFSYRFLSLNPNATLQAFFDAFTREYRIPSPEELLRNGCSFEKVNSFYMSLKPILKELMRQVVEQKNPTTHECPVCLTKIGTKWVSKMTCSNYHIICDKCNKKLKNCFVKELEELEEIQNNINSDKLSNSFPPCPLCRQPQSNRRTEMSFGYDE